MTVLNWPRDIAPVNGFFDLFEQAAVYTDPRTKSSLRQRRAAPIWTAQLQFGDLCPKKWKTLSALRARLDGPINTVRLFDYSDPRPGGLLGQDHFSDGTEFSDLTGFGGELTIAADAAAGAQTITVQSVFISEPEVFLAGDKIGMGEFPYLVLAAAGTNSHGVATLSISPPLLEAVVAGQEVVTNRPTGLFYLTSWQDPIQRDVAHFGNTTWSFTQDQFAADPG